MNKETFIAAYMAAFLGAFAANDYVRQCQNGWNVKDWQPVDDAETLAQEAWEGLQKL